MKRKDKGRPFVPLLISTIEAEVRTSHRKIREWFKELEYYGFIVLEQHGRLGVERKGKSPHWRLTELGVTSKASAEGIFEPPSNDFLRWNGVRFRRPGDRRTPGSYGCPKQNPASDGGYTLVPTGEAVALPTGDTRKPKSASDGVCIGAGESASDGVGITSLTTMGVLTLGSEVSSQITRGPSLPNPNGRRPAHRRS